MDKDENKKQHNLQNIAVAAGATEVVQRFGSAIKEHLVAYSGKDNETGQELVKSLKSISEQKINKDFEYQNLKQQAGFAAEVKEVANSNSEAIMANMNVRKIRTDDLGRVNDPLYDHVKMYADGTEILSQMKFVGKDPQEALQKLASSKFQKYLDNDVNIEVPYDFYDGIQSEADLQIQKLTQQFKDQSTKGNTAKAEELQQKINKYKKIKSNLRQSSVSNEDAMLARTNPIKSTIKSTAKIANQAGIETAVNSCIITGSISIVQNMVAVIKEEKTPAEAVKSVANDATIGMATGYATGFAGSALKGIMQNAGLQSIRALSKTNLAGTVVSATIGSTKIIARYFKGEITGLECFEQLGENGIGTISSAVFAAIGQAAIPIPVVGGLIGGMLGYSLSTASYKLLLDALKNEKLAKDQRIIIEKTCAEHIELIKQYRAETEETISRYLLSSMNEFHSSFDGIKNALELGDIDGFIYSTNNITESLGKKALFKNQDEFDLLMSNEDTIKF